MKYRADLHIHSKYSMATSKSADLINYCKWAKVKGINVLATSDFTHPAWFTEISEKLIPAEPGFFRLRNEPDDNPFGQSVSPGFQIRFVINGEISSIYKKNGKVRKIHNLVFVPDLVAAEKIRTKLDSIGNIHSDGRPILKLDSRNLVEIVKNASADAQVVPAHIWTPWFSLFGSRSGFDTLEECYGDMSDEIFALETGLSSDPAMNWRISALDKYTLISNSDAHSPAKLAREANVFNAEFDYPSMFQAVRTRKGFEGTLEFFPEEGKYHLDGHRKCSVCLKPEESVKLQGLCPECGKMLTLGVAHRVHELADRAEPKQPSDAPGYLSMVSLPQVLSQILSKGENTKTVQREYSRIIEELGDEISILTKIAVSDIKTCAGDAVANAIARIRNKEVHASGGYDGEFGTIHVVPESEVS
ncbi:MAG: endonuclease Q family protein [Spirochaetia bacterium]